MTSSLSDEDDDDDFGETSSLKSMAEWQRRSMAVPLLAPSLSFIVLAAAAISDC